MRLVLTMISVIGALFLFSFLGSLGNDTYEIKGKCLKTLISYDHRSLSTDYLVVVQYDDGEIEEIHPGAKIYFTYKEGQSYYCTKTRWTWKKWKTEFQKLK